MRYRKIKCWAINFIGPNLDTIAFTKKEVIKKHLQNTNHHQHKFLKERVDFAKKHAVRIIIMVPK